MYQPSETIVVPSDNVPQVGLNVYQKVGETFVDLSGFPVEPARVKQFTIRSAQGDLFTFNNGKPAWIPGQPGGPLPEWPDSHLPAVFGNRYAGGWLERG